MQTLAGAAPLGTLTIQVGKREASTGDGRKRRQARTTARKAKVTVRAQRVLLRPPARSGTPLPPVYVNVVLVREEKPPRGKSRSNGCC